jgi:hypothetical protein
MRINTCYAGCQALVPDYNVVYVQVSSQPAIRGQSPQESYPILSLGLPHRTKRNNTLLQGKTSRSILPLKG